jgi:hypothetical protein
VEEPLLRSALDHLVITAGTRAAGMAYVADVLGVAPREGGEHSRMGTHNALLRLGEAEYLEVLAANPDAPVPARPRWFDLDRHGANAEPSLVTWVVRTSDIHAAASRSPIPLGQIEAMTRGSLSWLITIPADGSSPLGGAAPVLIQWSTTDHPAASLPDMGCQLEELVIHHAEADRLDEFLKDIGLEGPVALARPDPDRGPGLTARIRTPTGSVLIAGL